MNSVESATCGVNSQAVRIGEFMLALRDVTLSDETDVLALHHRVFGSGADARWFAWKYGQDSNQGHGIAVGAWHEGQLVAYCGGVPRALRLHDVDLRGLQIGDVMVHPAWRGVFGRRGPFFQVSNSFYESKIGAAHSRAFELGFGFPNMRHLKLAVLLGLLHDEGVIQSLHWNSLPPTDFRLPWFWRWRPLQPSDPKFDRNVNAAWKRMQAELPHLILGQRDAAYIRWRYVDRPWATGGRAEKLVRYHFFELRYAWSSISWGVAIMDLHSATPQWLDWVGSVNLMQAASLGCRMEAAQAGAPELVAWASDSVAHQLANTDVMRREICAGLGIPTSSVSASHPVEKAGWWLMGGDTDFL